MSSRRTERNAAGVVEEDRRIVILCDRMGCLETRTLGGIGEVPLVSSVMIVVCFCVCMCLFV